MKIEINLDDFTIVELEILLELLDKFDKDEICRKIDHYLKDY
jgi:hypothetical protein